MGTQVRLTSREGHLYVNGLYLWDQGAAVMSLTDLSIGTYTRYSRDSRPATDTRPTGLHGETDKSSGLPHRSLC